MLCEHAECQLKRTRWLQSMKDSELREDELKNLLESGYRLKWTDHLICREEQRCVSAKEADQVLHSGFCIRFVQFEHTEYGRTSEWLWMGYSKIGVGLYRPLHLALLVNGNAPIVTVGTVYDPSRTPELWDETYTIRQCWQAK